MVLVSHMKFLGCYSAEIVPVLLELGIVGIYPEVPCWPGVYK
jgi:hypothetical protein